jgi:hypothetical protein
MNSVISENSIRVPFESLSGKIDIAGKSLGFECVQKMPVPPPVFSGAGMLSAAIPVTYRLRLVAGKDIV